MRDSFPKPPGLPSQLKWHGKRAAMTLASEVADPVDFPGLAAVGREGLLHARGLGRETSPDVADEHHAPLPELLVVQLQMIAREAAHERRSFEAALVQLESVDAPLMRLGVVPAQCLSLDPQLSVGGADVELLEVGARVEKLLVVRDAVVFDPAVRAHQPLRQPADVGVPVADEEVEVVRAVALQDRSLRL